MKLAGIIFSGGKARRLGGADKGAIVIGDKTCFDRVRDVILPHVDQLGISAGHSSPQDYAKPYAHIPDWPSDIKRPGVAFAILGALAWAKDNGFTAIITSPVDTPFLPIDYAKRLRAAFRPETPVVSQSASGQHALHALWPVNCLDALGTLILQEGVFKIQSLHTALGSTVCTFTPNYPDPFLNINTSQDVDIARKI